MAHVGGARLMLTGFNLIRIDVDTQVLNARLLPMVLGFLLLTTSGAVVHARAIQMAGLDSLSSHHGIWSLYSL